MKVIGYGKAREEDILAYEQEYGCKLPEDYKQFLLEFNGGEPEMMENYVVIPNIKSKKMKVCFFRLITKETTVKKMDRYLNKAVDEWGMFIDPTIVIPFVGIYGYVQIVMITKQGMEGIYVFDNQLALKESSKKKCLHKVCDTFTEFLDLIVPDEK